MTTVSPHWATWSLQSIKTEPKINVDRSVVSNNERSDHYEVQRSTSSEKGGLALFSQSLQDNIYESQWHDFEQDQDDKDIITAQCDLKTYPEEVAGPIAPAENTGSIDVDALFHQVKNMTESESKKVEGVHHLPQYRYDPLTPCESQSLLRALKLSKYIPPSAQELEEEKRILSCAKVEPTVRIDLDHPVDGDQPIDKRRSGNRINLETGKRIYTAGIRASGLILRENEEAKQILQTMCKQMLPRRNFDWILAQLTYRVTTMLGFKEEIPSSKTLIRDKVIQSIEDESMPIEHLAYVITLLAEASKVDVSQYAIIDPTKKARTRGRSLGYVKEQMTAQSKAIFDVLRLKLFPEMFDSEQKVVSKRIRSNVKVPKKEPPTNIKESQDHISHIDADLKEVLAVPEDGKVGGLASWQSIFPQLPKSKSTPTFVNLEMMARREEVRNGEEAEINTASKGLPPARAEVKKEATVSPAPKPTKRKAKTLPDSVKGKKARQAQMSSPQKAAEACENIRKNADDEKAELTLTMGDSLNFPRERLSRSSSISECGDFKLPLPPFWNKKNKN